VEIAQGPLVIRVLSIEKAINQLRAAGMAA
jgi:hypothetical protein